MMQQDLETYISEITNSRGSISLFEFIQFSILHTIDHHTMYGTQEDIDRYIAYQIHRKASTSPGRTFTSSNSISEGQKYIPGSGFKLAGHYFNYIVYFHAWWISQTYPCIFAIDSSGYHLIVPYFPVKPHLHLKSKLRMNITFPKSKSKIKINKEINGRFTYIYDLDTVQTKFSFRINKDEQFPSSLKKLISMQDLSFCKRKSSSRTLQDAVCRTFQATDPLPYIPLPDKIISKTRKRQRDYVTNWTTKVYKKIQNARRNREKIHAINRVQRINAYLAQKFRDTHLRAPIKPREFSDIRVLYRGIHNPLASILQRDKTLSEKGYIAFSRDKEEAKGFGELLLYLPVNAIPAGTPWIWYTDTDTPHHARRRNVNVSVIDEGEVLLPPGTLTLGREIDDDEYIVHYTPDKEATSLRGKKLHRKEVWTHNRQNNDPTHYHAIFH